MSINHKKAAQKNIEVKIAIKVCTSFARALVKVTLEGVARAYRSENNTIEVKELALAYL